MINPNSGLSCSPVYQEVKASVTFECPTGVGDDREDGYDLEYDSQEYDYIETVYNEVEGITLKNGVIREKWDNSNDPRFQQYDIDTGQPIFENYCRGDAGLDEGYFQHLWEFPTNHTSNREVLVKYTPVYEDEDGQPTNDASAATDASLAASAGACVRKVNVTNNFTLGKVAVNLSGLPSGDDASFIQLVGTDSVEIIFEYVNDTRTVVKVGDVINGHTVTDVVNFVDTRADRKIVHRVLGDKRLKLNNTTDVSVGDNVIGYAGTVIPDGTTVKSVNKNNNTIKLNFPSGFEGLDSTQNNKIRTILIQDANQNQIPNTNFCWAKLGSTTNVGVKNVSFKVEGPGIHYMDFATTTTSSGSFTNTKIDNEGGNAIFNSGSTRTKTVKFDGGELVLKAEPVDDGGEYDSKWYISSFTGTLPDIGTAFQTKLDGGKGKATIHFKVTGTAPNTTAASGSNFVKDAVYVASESLANIRVKAGYGIIDRAAAVGIFISKRKDVIYTPIFQIDRDVITPEMNDLKNNFPGLATIRDFRDSGITTPVTETNCDPFLSPKVNLPTVVGKTNNTVVLNSSVSTDIQEAIDAKVDEISSTADVDELVEAIEQVVKEKSEEPEVNQETLDILNSNLRKINKAQNKSDRAVDKFAKFEGNAEPTVGQDSATNKLINDILGKIDEIPDDLGTLIPEGVPRSVKVIDGSNESDFNLVKNAYRDLPATQDGIQFVAEDISLNDDQSYLDYGKNSLRTTINMEVCPRWLLGSQVVGDEIAEEAELKIDGASIGGVTGTNNDLYVLVNNVNNSGAITKFQVFGGSVPQMKYTNLTPTNTAVGTRASFNITSSGGGYTAVINTNTTGYTVNSLIKINGSQLGGTNNTNDCSIFITGLTSGGEIDTFTVSGTSTGAATFNNRSQSITTAKLDVAIEWNNTDQPTDDFYVPTVNKNNSGSGYRPNDTITIAGTSLSGAAGNNLIITVTQVNLQGGLVDFDLASNTGSPLTLFTGVAASYANGGSNTSLGSGATFNVLKGENAAGSPAYIAAVNNAGSNYNTVVQPVGVTVDVVDAGNGILKVNNADLSAYPANFSVTFGTSSPSGVSTGVSYKAAKISNTKFYLYTEQTYGGTTPNSGLGPTITSKISLGSSPQGITGVSFGSFGVTQTVSYITDNGVQYVDQISVSSLGEVYPEKVWKGKNFEYQGDFIKEYEFNLITTSENLAKSSFNEGNPIQARPTTAIMTKKLKPKSNKIKVDDTSMFLSSGYLIIPKWIRKTENYLELGVEGVNKMINARNHYYYDGEEVVYYASKTATTFEGIERSQFNTSYLFETSPEPFAKNGGVVNSYQKGYSVQQYWPYQPKEE